jgi:hypothetical protein
MAKLVSLKKNKICNKKTKAALMIASQKSTKAPPVNKKKSKK